MEKNRAIFVLGMHRSGTSAITRIINLMGADLGRTLLSSLEGNPTGHWENQILLDLHEELLKRINSSWDDLHPLPEQWWESEVARDYLPLIRQALGLEFNDLRFWAFKDPRLCRLFPFWKILLKKMDCTVSVIFPFRHPTEVADSMTRRNGFSSWKGYLLWLRHVLEAEQASRDCPRVFFAYTDLLADWKSVLDNISTKLDIPFPQDREMFEQEVNSFLDPQLHHEKVDSSSFSEDPLHQLVAETYTALLNVNQNPETDLAPALDGVARKLKSLEQELIPTIEHFETMLKHRKTLGS